MAGSSSPIIGIDLGTTNSCVAVPEGQDIQVLANAEGKRTTPSVVHIKEDESVLVGEVARRGGATAPQRTLYSIKRFIGKKFDTDEVQRDKANVPYKVIKAENGDSCVEVGGKAYSPVEISSMILQKLKQDSEKHLGVTVMDAVITVPAYFNDAQRQATKDAGQVAGLNVRRILNEPTAAALAYDLQGSKMQKVAVYDLGGGTFDVSCLELTNGLYQVVSTNGNTHLGGDDFDVRVAGRIMQHCEKDLGFPTANDPLSLFRITEAAEQAKRELSGATQATVQLPFLGLKDGSPVHVNWNLTREELNRLTQDLVLKTLDPCRKALSDANWKPEELDAVILVGGMTRMPAVQAAVEQFFKKKPYVKINPDEAVALGAAIQASVLGGTKKDVVLLDVTPLPMGVEVAGGRFSELIAKNTSIPTKRVKLFTTVEDQQKVVRVRVLQGNNLSAAGNQLLGVFDLGGLPPAPAGVPQIEVTFSIDANGIVNVQAMELVTRRKAEIRVQAGSGHSSEELQRMASRAKDRLAEASRTL